MKLQRGTVQADIERWLKSYRRNLKYSDRSKNTLSTYERILTKFQLFIDEQDLVKGMKDMNKEFFLDFVEHCEENSKRGVFSKKTKQLYTSVLKSFFVYISDNNDEFHTYENEFKILPKGSNKEKKVKYLSDDEVEKITDYLDDMRLNRGTYYDHIYALGIKLMLFGGLRISEVLNVKLGEITVSDLVDEKGNKDIYEVHLPETKSGDEQTGLIKIEDIEGELEYFRNRISRDEHIFQSAKKNTLIHRSNFYVGVRTIMANAGVNKKGLHIYRHTCAMQLYRKSKDIMVTKEKLRHSDIKTTMIYAHAEKSDIANAMR